MRTPHSNEKEKEVIKLYYSGHTYDEIHDKLNVSTGYISDLINQLKQKHDANEVTSFRELGTHMKKYNITATDASVGCNVASLLKRFEININDLQSFLKNLYDQCKNNNLDPKTLIEYGKMLFALQETSDIPLDNIEVKYNHLVQETQKTTKDISQLNDDVKNAKDDTEKALSEKNLTLKQVSEYVKDKNSLATYGIDFDDISKFVTMLNKAKSDDFDIQKSLNQLQKEGDSEQRIEQNKHEISQLEEQKEELEKQNKGSRDELAANQPYLDIIRQFELDEIKVTFLEDIYKTITEISKQHRINKEDAIVKFHETIQNNYDTMLGLDASLKTIKNEINAKSIELDLLKTRIENLTLKYSKEQSIISVLKSLKQKVIPQMIISWNNIFEKANLNPKDFETYLEKIGTLEKITLTKQQEIDKLASDAKRLNIEINVLDENKESLETKINHIEEIAEKRFEKYTKSLQEQFFKFYSNSLRTVEGVATHSIDELSKTESNVRNNLGEITSELEELIKNNLKASEQIGKLKMWVPLYEFVAESKFDSDTISILIMLLERIHLRFRQDNISTSDLDHFISQLRKMIS